MVRLAGEQARAIAGPLLRLRTSLEANRAHFFLNGRADDIARGAMVTEIDDFDPMADEFEIDRIDCAVMPVANRDSSEETDR